MSDNPLAEAASVTTNPVRLIVLSVDPDLEVQRLVAANPSVPLKAALLLCERFPDEFVTNPSFALWSLEDPLLLTTLSRNAALALVKARSLTYELLHALALHPSGRVRAAVIESPLATVATFEQAAQPWPRQEFQPFFAALTCNPRTPVHLLELLLGMNSDTLALATNPATPDYLRQASLERRLMDVTALPPLPQPPTARLHLLHDPDEWTRARLASDPGTAPWMLRRLARAPEVSVRLAVVRNPHTPESPLRMLRLDHDYTVSSEATKRLRAASLRP